jgi:uncharacterized protein YecE (DUF72 family)
VAVLVGCSGWSYDDWVGRFYPIDVGKDKGKWFPYYSRYFSTVEINSTYYRVPSEPMVKGWIKKASEVEGFEYAVKMPKLVTHESMVRGEAGKASRQAASFEDLCIGPMSKADCWGCGLIQLSPYFRNEEGSIRTLAEVLDALSPGDHSYAVEFRHRSWLDDEGREFTHEVLDVLRERNVACVMVDGPGSPITRGQTADHAYIRFHGRNHDIWFREGDENDHRINRYDYLYTDEQLGRWVSIIDEVGEKTKNVRLYFNNHGRAKAAKNALQMMDLLSIPHREKEVRLQDQMKLGSYE